MKIISGTARGRKLLAPDGMQTRPTTDMVKQSVFNIIQFEISGKTFLDLFAGSGQIGAEALSRNAKHAVFVDNRADCIKIINQNLHFCGFEKNYSVLCCDALNFIRTNKGNKFDIIFLDPPYMENLLVGVLEAISAFDILDKNGIIICESLKKDDFYVKCRNLFALRKEYYYGKKKITVLERMP